MRKVLFIYGLLNHGGVSTLIYRKSKWLVENGYEVFILTSSIGEMNDKFLDSKINLIIDDNIFHKPGKMIFSLFLSIYTNVVSKINGIDDLQFIECFTPLETVYGIIIANLMNKKLISGIYHPQSYSDGFVFDNKNYFKLFKQLDTSGNLHFINNDVIKSHEEYFNYIVKNKNIFPIPILDKGKRNSFQRQNITTFLSISRICSYKKYYYGLISDYDMYWKENEDSRLLIIGYGDEEKEVLRYAKEFKSYRNGNIVFLGKVNYEKVEEYVDKADLVIGMGTSILEAAMRGVPAVVAPAYVSNNISNGFVYEDIKNIGDTKNSCTKTYYEMFNYIKQIDDETYDNICRKCRERVLQYYEMNNVMSRFHDYVDSCNVIILDNGFDYFKEEKPYKIFFSSLKRKYIK